MSIYKPIKIKTIEIAGFVPAFHAMRFPKNGISKSRFLNSGSPVISKEDLELASKLVNAGTEHAKSIRGIKVWFEIEMQVGFMIEFVTYRIGIDDLSTTSSMHSELKKLKGDALAEQKQLDLPNKVYKRMCVASYQALRNIYLQRKNHRHPDWQLFCEWIKTLPYSKELITLGA